MPPGEKCGLADFESIRNRYGLSLVAVMVADCREVPLPGVCVGLDFKPDVAAMPMLLHHFQCLNGAEPAWVRQSTAYGG